MMTNGWRRTCLYISQNPAQVTSPNAIASPTVPVAEYVSHIRISVRYSWSVQTWSGTVNVKRSCEGSFPFSTIQRPTRRCHQKSGSWKPSMNSIRIASITPPISSVRALSLSVSRTPGASAQGLERIGRVARHSQCVRGVVVRKSASQDALLPAHAEHLTNHEIQDGKRARPARRRQIDPDGGDDLAQVDGVPAERIRPSGHQPPRLRHDRERTAKVRQPPNRICEAEGRHDVGRDHQPVVAPASGQEARRHGGEGAGEGDDDDGEPVVGALRRQAGAVHDDPHREVRQGEGLLEHKEVVEWHADVSDALPQS